MPGRNIRYEPSCDLAAEALGGYEAIDEALFVYLEALDRNPSAFRRSIPIGEA
jgi:hypothetical protein